MRIVLASRNPVKKQAVLGGFGQVFPHTEFELVCIDVPSGVRAQPFSDGETLTGANNRALGARTGMPEADFWVGVEGGVDELAGGLAAFAWVVILDRKREGKARTGTFFLPPRVAEMVRDGAELGEADDAVFGRSNSKQENGAIGLLTGDVVQRARLYEQAVILALVPFINPGLYP
jgi:inosine/xanthosine triphosphatase